MISLDKSPRENVEAVAAAKGVAPHELIVCVLDRPRHAGKLIAELRAIGCGIQLIPDGDVAGVIATTDEDTTIDLYMGSGGAPEGVLAAAALRCVGGQFNGRLLFRNEAETRARANGASTISTGSTCSRTSPRAIASSPRPESPTARCSKASSAAAAASMTTESVVMRASTGTVRWVRTEHHCR